MKSLDIQSLLAEEKATEQRLKEVRNAIAILQRLCDHDFEPAGHDSHHDYQRCKRCGHEEQA